MEKKHTDKCAINSNVGIPANQKDASYCDCDGYHTFGELYDHRIALFIALAHLIQQKTSKLVWKSKKHNDDSEFEGWFIMGIGDKEGEQITYHLPLNKWDECRFANTLQRGFNWDGHTSDDVIARLKTLIS